MKKKIFGISLIYIAAGAAAYYFRKPIMEAFNKLRQPKKIADVTKTA